MKNPLIVFVSFLSLGIISCTNMSQARLKNSIKQSGQNSVEIEKVLNHYSHNPSDSLKYKAACFLIENMGNKYTTTNEVLDNFDSEFDLLLSELKESDYSYKDPYINSKIWRTKVEQIWKNVVKNYDGALLYRRTLIPDCKTIKSDFLIENIDKAFEAWSYPWAKHLSFDQFCEYVLPYRFEDEPLTSWRPYFMDQYKWIADSIKDKTDPVEVCTIINNHIASWFHFDGMFNSYPRAAFPLPILLKTKIGGCPLQAEIASFAMRAMGLGIANDHIPHWGNRSQGHQFCSVISKNGDFIDFLGGELSPGQNEIRDKATKIFRKTFSSKNIDVTAAYIRSATIAVDFPTNLPHSINMAYLYVFNNEEWIPVMQGEIKKKRAFFKDMGCNIVYLPVFTDKSDQKFYGSPFLLNENGVMEPFSVDEKEKQNIVLERKYPHQQRMIDFSTHMIGGKFQGANISDFSDAVDLHIIKDIPHSYLKYYSIEEKQFRYVRFILPPIDDKHRGNISEISFKGCLNKKDTISIVNGINIGSPEILEYHSALLFDHKLDDYVTINIADTIISDYPSRVITVSSIQKVLWVGLDLKRKHYITQLAYCPRNDTNNLYEDCNYELFYWNDKWISLGEGQFKENQLYYNNVPTKALFLLRNNTEGKEERIFSYENGKQIFW